MQKNLLNFTNYFKIWKIFMQQWVYFSIFLDLVLLSSNIFDTVEKTILKFFAKFKYEAFVIYDFSIRYICVTNFTFSFKFWTCIYMIYMANNTNTNLHRVFLQIKSLIQKVSHKIFKIQFHSTLKWTHYLFTGYHVVVGKVLDGFVVVVIKCCAEITAGWFGTFKLKGFD